MSPARSIHEEKWQSEPEQMIEDVQISIHNVVSMIPPSVPNTLQEYLHGVVSGEIVPAMCHDDTRVDTAKYWEKRRVQNLLRRMLESLQERFGFEGDEKASDFGGVGYDALVRWAMQRNNSSSGLDEQTFLSALEVLDAWPPELSDGDRREVFVALLAPSIAAVNLLAAGQPLPRYLTRRMFCEGMARAPFNVPDFPVPLHLLPAAQSSSTSGRSRGHKHQLVNEAAQAIATVFCEQALDRVKDFFMCGLLSLEEIQVAVPKLQKASIVEEAVRKVIRVGARRFTVREWQSLVVSVWTPEASLAQQLEVAEMQHQYHTEVALQKKEREARELLLQQTALPCLASPATEYRGTNQEEREAKPQLQRSQSQEERQRQPQPGYEQPSVATPRAPQTEPLPPREVLVEEPVNFMHSGQSSARDFEPRSSCFIDWSAPSRSSGEVGRPGLSLSLSVCGGHSADEGAGTQRDSCEMEGEQGADPVSWISVELHSECHGPFLARAFVRCCQLYDAPPC